MKETIYVSHGSPTLSIDKTLPARHFLESFKQTVFSEKPKSILVISGHWETEEPAVTTSDGVLPTIYDFYNFPKAMYEITYPARGSPTLARRVVEVLADAGFQRMDEDGARGLDHGAWVPLMLMYPEADIPVCQLSVQPGRDAMWHYKVGRALAPLKEEGVLIVGSGSTTHNLRTIKRNADDSVAPWAMEFDTWLKNSLLNGKYEDVNNYVEKAPHAKLAHPHPDHFYPLHVAMGAAGESPKAELIHTSWGGHTLSYSSYKFTSKASRKSQPLPQSGRKGCND